MLPSIAVDHLFMAAFNHDVFDSAHSHIRYMMRPADLKTNIVMIAYARLELIHPASKVAPANRVHAKFQRQT